MRFALSRYVHHYIYILFLLWGEKTNFILHNIKNHKKVSFNNASEASYVYNLSGQKFNQKCQKWSILASFENLKLAVKQCYQTGQFKMDKN